MQRLFSLRWLLDSDESTWAAFASSTFSTAVSIREWSTVHACTRQRWFACSSSRTALMTRLGPRSRCCDVARLERTLPGKSTSRAAARSAAVSATSVADSIVRCRTRARIPRLRRSLIGLPDQVGPTRRLAQFPAGARLRSARPWLTWVSAWPILPRAKNTPTSREHLAGPLVGHGTGHRQLLEHITVVSSARDCASALLCISVARNRLTFQSARYWCRRSPSAICRVARRWR